MAEVPMRKSVLAVLVALLPTGAFAQNPPPPPPDPQKPPAAAGEQGKKPTRNFASALVHNLGDDIKHLPRQNSIYWLAGGSAAALAIHPADDNINHHFAGSGTTDALWKPGQVIGNTAVLLGAGATTYLIGRGTKSDRAQHLGMDVLEAEILSAGLVYGIKESVRRERPENTEGTNATGFSFPSGHAASTFAAATVLQ